LKELKQDEATMHIPVHLMSAGEAAANRVRKEGAISFLKKPVNTETLDKLFADIMAKAAPNLNRYYWLKIIRPKARPLKI
jgi:FixJ family two-component response regulator